MKIVFSSDGWDDYIYWQENDGAILVRINEVIRDTARSPFKGIGKPEPLSGNLKGWWSRRITREHRLIYRVKGSNEEQALEILACRHHYD
ncbi:Txe/YoeB family addiction module toxin [Labrys okinawensis]|uniref:Txe/YoeB family addiction module toxin n=1 Tax=Labrys okinawensis TaxID=346911 RepID=UPI0039BD04E5